MNDEERRKLREARQRHRQGAKPGTSEAGRIKANALRAARSRQERIRREEEQGK